LLKVGAGASAAKAILKEPSANTLTAQAIDMNLPICPEVVKTKFDHPASYYPES
jgi:hypothetical protein